MKIWTCGRSPRSGSRNAWTRIKNVNGARRLSNFWNFFDAIQMISCRARLVTTDETWLYHYDPETKQQSMEWRHSGSPCPKIFRVKKIRWKSSRFDFGGSRWHPRYWLSSKGPKYQRGELLISAGATEGHFLRKNAALRSPRGSCSCTTMPRLTGQLQPRRNWLIWASSVLITHPILLIWPHWTTTCSLDWKKAIDRSPFFIRRGGHFCRGDLVWRTTFWFFFEWPAKVRATG